jgi:hypothetical protein
MASYVSILGRLPRGVRQRLQPFGRSLVAILMTGILGWSAVATASPPSIEVGVATGVPGQQVTFTATLHTGGAQIAGIQNDIGFDPNVPIAGINGQPDCTVNPAIKKGATFFTFLPLGCSGAACTSMRALVLALNNATAIPDGSILYTCNAAISPATAVGIYPLNVSNVISSSPAGVQLPSGPGIDGKITVLSRDNCCQCPDSCVPPVSGSCGGCTLVLDASCGGGPLCAMNTPTPMPTPLVAPCVGDCDGSGDVTVDDLIIMVNIALGSSPLAACPIGDADGSGGIAVNEIIQAVGFALTSCPHR